MDADGECRPINSGRMDNHSHAYQPTTSFALSSFWNKKQFIWNIFNSVVCSTLKAVRLWAGKQARPEWGAISARPGFEALN